MKSKLRDLSARDAWDATKDAIVQDLSSNPPGQKYFSRTYWSPEDKFAYNASDNFLCYEQYGKKYRIHDGFIGYIKSALYVCKVLSNDNNIMWPISTEDDDLSKKLNTLV